MKEVSDTEFWAYIGERDAHPYPQGTYPYTSVFKNPRTGQEYGRIVEELLGNHQIKSKYFLGSYRDLGVGHV